MPTDVFACVLCGAEREDRSDVAVLLSAARVADEMAQRVAPHLRNGHRNSWCMRRARERVAMLAAEDVPQ
jgi:hypothetical protein